MNKKLSKVSCYRVQYMKITKIKKKTYNIKYVTLMWLQNDSLKWWFKFSINKIANIIIHVTYDLAS